MPHVETFGNVGWGILNDEFLAFSQSVCTVFRGAWIGEVMYLSKDASDKRGSGELKVEERFVVRYGWYVVIWLELIEYVSLIW